jgi:hypothetical protein
MGVPRLQIWARVVVQVWYKNATNRWYGCDVGVDNTGDSAHVGVIGKGVAAMPTLRAVVTSHSTREDCGSGYTATFRYLMDNNGPELRQYPHIEIPCDTYEQACAVVDAFNKG